MKLEELYELKWSGSVKTKKHPPEELFSKGTADDIVAWLKGAHANLKSAMSSLNFYINRAGKNLSTKRRAVLDTAKEKLSESIELAEAESLQHPQILSYTRWKAAVKDNKYHDYHHEDGEHGEEIVRDPKTNEIVAHWEERGGGWVKPNKK